jgi:hypothetical protein
LFTGYGTIDVFDISNPSAPVQLSTITAPHTMDVDYALAHRTPLLGFGWQPRPNHLEVAGNTLFAGWQGEGLRIFDISRPSAPREIGSWTGEGIAPGDPPLWAWEVIHHQGLILLNGFRYGIYILQVQ